MNSTIRVLMRKRNRIHHKAVKTQNPLHWERYRYLRNKVIDEIRASRQKYNKKISDQINKSIPPGKWWRIVKSLCKLNNKHKPSPPLKVNGQTLFHPIDKANAFNNFFTNISTISVSQNLAHNVPDPPLHHMNTHYITDNEVLDQLQAINISKPSGPDSITPRILKQVAHVICKPLAKLFNMSLSNGVLPHIWKIAMVTPVFKNKGTPDDVNNYRPISVTSVICKLLEKIIVKHLNNFILENNILYKYQSGFQSGDSTTNQLVEIYNTIVSNLDKGKDIRFIFCDISKAFDRVWHEGIILKLKQYGISSQIINWVKNYLWNRKQKVVLDGFTSSLGPTNSGVPQGSVLGPFLFLLYINDIASDLSNNVRLFADDTSLYVIVDQDIMEAADSLTKDLDKLDKWSKKWMVDFNPKKTINLNFTRKNISHPTIKFGNNGPDITIQNNHVHLGLNFQSDANWKLHIQGIYEKACSRLNMLRMLKHTLCRDALIKIYLSFIRPVLEYGDVIWDNCNDRESDLLEDVQITAARIITGLRINSSRTKLYYELGWDMLSERRKVHKLILFYKMVNHMVPTYLENLLEPCIPPITPYPLRNHDESTYTIPQARTTSYLKSFIPSTVKLWNDLPLAIRSLPKLACFSNAIKKYFFKTPTKLFNLGNRRENIIHCQLRNNASSLNADLFCDFIRENSVCDYCGFHTENANHFFFECPKYNDERNCFFHQISMLNLQKPITLDLLLYGDNDVSYDENVKLFKLVHEYIKKSRRFV